MKRFASVLFGTAAAFMGSPAWAQSPPESEAGTNGLEEVVVTARLQSETLMRVPVADSVISGETLGRYDLSDLAGVSALVPSVRLERTAGPTGAALTIRGVASADNDPGVEQSVATVIDGMQISKGVVVQQSLFDMNQVEILKGPQALFFGKNVSAGVISLHSNDPTEKFEAYVNTGYEFYAQEETLEGAISGPISDNWKARFAFRGSTMRGWMENDAAPTANPFFPADPLPGAKSRHNFNRDLFGRVTVVYEPNTNFKATFKAYGGVQRDTAWGQNNEIGNCGRPPFASFVSGRSVFPDPNSDCTLNGHQSVGGLPAREAAPRAYWRDGFPYGEYESTVASLTLDYDTDLYALTSTTGYYRFREDIAYNGTNVVYPYAGYVYAGFTIAQLSQELRAVTKFEGPVNVTTGAYFDSDSLDHFESIILAALPPDPVTGMYDTFNRIAKPTGKTYSAFGQARWNITPKVEIAAGARYTHDDKKGELGNIFINPTFAALRQGFFSKAGTIFRDTAGFDNVSPEASLTWKPQDDLMVYGAFKTGYKSGGFAAPALVAPNAAPPGSVPGQVTSGFKYAPEKVMGGEVGAKMEFFAKSLRLTGTAYRYDYKDLQFSNFISAPVPTVETLNVGRLRTQGVELEGLWRATHGLTLHGGAAYTHARYVDFVGAGCFNGQTAAGGCLTYTSGPLAGSTYQNLTGKPPQRAPDWTFNVGYTYDYSLSDTLVLGLSTDLRYTSSYLLQQNESPFAVQRAYAILDAAVHLGTADERWQVSLIGRNLTNEYYAINSVDKPGGAFSPTTGEDTSAFVGRPRQVEIQLGLRF